MTDVIYSGEDNQFDNWENLGSDDMFDTADSVVSETKSDYKSPDHAEEFAESRGFSIATESTIEVTTTVFYDFDGDAGFGRETSTSQKKVLSENLTYSKSYTKLKTENISGRTIELMITKDGRKIGRWETKREIRRSFRRDGYKGKSIDPKQPIINIVLELLKKCKN